MSTIDPSSIDITYPIAGQDNDTKGFHDNYRQIQNNLLYAKADIEGLQANAVAQAFQINSLQAFNSNVKLSNIAYPITSTSIGTAGQVAYDATHIYLCVNTNTWVRANMAVW